MEQNPANQSPQNLNPEPSQSLVYKNPQAIGPAALNDPNNKTIHKHSKLTIVLLSVLAVIIFSFSPLIAIASISGMGFMEVGSSNIFFLIFLSILFLIIFILPILIVLFLIKKLTSRVNSDIKPKKIYIAAVILNYINYLIITSFFLFFGFIGNVYAAVQNVPFLSQSGFLLVYSFIIATIYILFIDFFIAKIVFSSVRSFIYLIVSGVSILISGLEIIIILKLIGFFASIIIPITPLQDDTKLGHISQLEIAMETYYSINQKLPQSLSDLDKRALNVPVPDTSELEYKINSQTQYSICSDFKTDNRKKIESEPNYPKEYLHGKGHQCFDFNISTVYVKYPQKPTNLDPKYQPMVLSGGFYLPKSNRGDHILQAKVVGKNCSGTDGKNDNRITVHFDSKFGSPYGDSDRYVYRNWEIWDTGCGLEEGNPISFTLDNKPVGVRHSRYDQATENDYRYTCLPFIANKKMTGNGGYTGSFVEIEPEKSPDLNCEKVDLPGAYPGTPTPTQIPVSTVTSRDSQRKLDLSNLQKFVNYYRELNGHYPQNLSQAVALNSTYTMKLDPLTKQPYTYVVNQNGKDYQLCGPSFENIQEKCVNSSTNPHFLK